MPDLHIKPGFIGDIILRSCFFSSVIQLADLFGNKEIIALALEILLTYNLAFKYWCDRSGSESVVFEGFAGRWNLHRLALICCYHGQVKDYQEGQVYQEILHYTLLHSLCLNNGMMITGSAKTILYCHILWCFAIPLTVIITLTNKIDLWLSFPRNLRDIAGQERISKTIDARPKSWLDVCMNDKDRLSKCA